MTHPIAELRLQILANGYPIIPVNGKVPEFSNWQNTKATPEAVSRWPTNNTAVLTATVPALDLDVTNPEAADALEEAVKEWFADRGATLVRFGNAPKRAILFRTATPFPKVTRNLVDAHGRVHRVELLGSGQQIVVHGPHAETKRPYSWAANRSPATVPYNDLPPIDGAEALQLVDYLVTMLVEQFGFTEGTAPTGHTGANGSAAHVPLEERVENMEYSGVYPYNDTLLAMTMDRLDSGIPVEDVIKEGLELVRRNAPERNKDGKVWDWDMLRKQLGRMCYGHINKKHSGRPQLVDCLPDPIRIRWRAREAAGETNIKVWWSGVNGGSWCVRGEAAGGTEKPQPGAAPPIPLTVTEWLARDLPPPDRLLGAWFTTTSRILLSADTGLGKTNLGMTIAVHMGAGVDFLHWQARRPARILYIDGEMSRRLFRDRIVDVVRRLGVSPPNVLFLSREDVEDFAPLNTPKGAAWLNRLLEKIGPVDAIVFDNIMALLDGDMKEEEGWTRILPLVNSLTKRCVGQLWVNHTGHDASRSYGSHTKTWRMDTVMHLAAVERADTDLSFTLEFHKARERTPDNREDFEEITIALVDDMWTSSSGAARPRGKPSAQEASVLEAFNAILAGSDAKTIRGRRAVPTKPWCDLCVHRALVKGDNAFRNIRSRLVAKRLIECGGDWTWPS